MKLLISSLLLILSVTLSHAQSLTPADAGSKVAFTIKNMGLNVDGSLSGLKGKITFDPKKAKSASFDVTVDVETINTDNEKRDKHLKTADFFDAAKYPVIRIASTKILPKPNNVYYAEATLTIKNVSKKIAFDFVAKPQGNGYLLTANFKINRLDYGVGKSSMTLSDDLRVSLSITANK